MIKTRTPQVRAIRNSGYRRWLFFSRRSELRVDVRWTSALWSSSWPLFYFIYLFSKSIYSQKRPAVPHTVGSCCSLPRHHFRKTEYVHRDNVGGRVVGPVDGWGVGGGGQVCGQGLPVHHGISVQGHEENLATASWSDWGKEDLPKKRR